MNKRLAPIALSVGLLGLVGGVAAANAFQPAGKPAPRQVEIVQPAAQTSTPTTDAAKVAAEAKAKAAAAAKAKAAKVAAAKKLAAQKAMAKAKAAKVQTVESSKAPAPQPSTVQRQALVSEPAPEPTVPEPTSTTRSAADSYRQKMQNPPTPPAPPAPPTESAPAE